MMISSKIKNTHRSRCRDLGHRPRRNLYSNIGSTGTTMSSIMHAWLAAIVIIPFAITRTSVFFAFSFSTVPSTTRIRKNCKKICANTKNPSIIPTPSSPTTKATTPFHMASSSPNPSLGAPICVYHQVGVSSSEKNPVPRQAISVEDLTPILQTLLEESGMVNGLLTVISRHTTTSITINEWESRLADDIAETLLKLVPPDERSISPASEKDITYKHNDIHFRPFGDSSDKDAYHVDNEEANRCRENGWDVDDPTQLQAWRDQEPINAHSHLLSILAGSGSESIPVVDGQMVLGQWQSVLLLDLDGPRDRTVGVQFMGYS
mmetsp:Transcript_205/g.596  ORF Transcript_205/g.596 Transcript_205/m.596 type:complete len:320 (+) Transcript_205:170-1129(+)